MTLRKLSSTLKSLSPGSTVISPPGSMVECAGMSHTAGYGCSIGQIASPKICTAGALVSRQHGLAVCGCSSA